MHILQGSILHTFHDFNVLVVGSSSSIDGSLSKNEREVLVAETKKSSPQEVGSTWIASQWLDSLGLT